MTVSVHRDDAVQTAATRLSSCGMATAKPETMAGTPQSSTPVITYTDEKRFTQDQAKRLFRSVGWESAGYPERLYKALMGSSTVFTAWDGERLVGLARVIDDGEMLAYLHWVLVDPAYHGCGIGGRLVELVREWYHSYFFLEVMPEERTNAPFYERHGFQLMENGAAMQIVNRG